jgi:hypothetical protein
VAQAGAVSHPMLTAAGAITVILIALSASVLGLGIAVLLMGVAVSATLAVNLTRIARRGTAPEQR